MARRAFVALFASAGVLVSVVGAGAVLGAHETYSEAQQSDIVAQATPTEGWILTPGAIALLLSSAFVLLRSRKS